MKKKNLSDLEKARDHFLRAFTEIIIGADFAIKGTRELLSEREGRKMMIGLTGGLIRKGFNLATKLSDLLTQVQSEKPAKQRARRKRMRKVEIE
jgi:hypothetical protein